MASIVFGLVAIALGLWGLSTWWWSVVEVLRGVVPLLLILIGPVALGAGITRLRENSEVEAVLAEGGLDDVAGDTLKQDTGQHL
ncbi:MAG: hypothetical protein HQL87_02870 [Magnetococcales bacterium]|nr:hypothetical protein [Magnetococcales bacterium]